MIKCKKCKGRMFVDRQYSSIDHLEIFCILCGSRRFYRPPADSEEGRWLLIREKLRAKTTIASL